MLSADHLALDVNKVSLNALSLSGEDKFGSGGNNFSRYSEITHLGAGISANSAQGTVGDMNLKGSSFIAKDTTGLTIGNVKAESAVNSYDTESRQSSRSTFSSGSSYRKSHTEENSASNLMLGKNAVITGNVEGIGSNIILGENTSVGGKVTTDSRELHNSYYEKNKSKGFNSGISHGTVSAGYGKSQNTIVFLIILISFEISSVILYAFAIFITLLYYTTLYSVSLMGFSIRTYVRKTSFLFDCPKFWVHSNSYHSISNFEKSHLFLSISRNRNPHYIFYTSFYLFFQCIPNIVILIF